MRRKLSPPKGAKLPTARAGARAASPAPWPTRPTTRRQPRHSRVQSWVGGRRHGDPVLGWAFGVSIVLGWDITLLCSPLAEKGVPFVKPFFLGSSSDVSLYHVKYSEWFTRISGGICKPGLSWLSISGFYGLRGKVLQKTKREAVSFSSALARLVSLLHSELVPFAAAPASQSPQFLHRILLCPPRLAWVSTTSPACSVFKNVWSLSSCSLWDLLLLGLGHWAGPFPSVPDAAEGAACPVASRHCPSPQLHVAFGHSCAPLPCCPRARWQFLAASTAPRWAHLPLASAASVVATPGSRLMY